LRGDIWTDGWRTSIHSLLARYTAAVLPVGHTCVQRFSSKLPARCWQPLFAGQAFFDSRWDSASDATTNVILFVRAAGATLTSSNAGAAKQTRLQLYWPAIVLYTAAGLSLPAASAEPFVVAAGVQLVALGRTYGGTIPGLLLRTALLLSSAGGGFLRRPGAAGATEGTGGGHFKLTTTGRRGRFAVRRHWRGAAPFCRYV